MFYETLCENSAVLCDANRNPRLISNYKNNYNKTIHWSMLISRYRRIGIDQSGWQGKRSCWLVRWEFPTICEGDPAPPPPPPPDWFGSLDSFPQEHFTMFSPMTVPFTPQMAFVADSLLENLPKEKYIFKKNQLDICTWWKINWWYSETCQIWML